MGSRYDIAVYRGATLADFEREVAELYTLGEAVAAAWQNREDVAVSEQVIGADSFVIVASPPMQTPRRIDTTLADKLGARESAFATVWDSVSTYSLSVHGDGIDRLFASEPSGDDDGTVYVDNTGARLPEEPRDPEISEYYVQVVLEKRYGIDVDKLGAPGFAWRLLQQRADD